MKCWLYFVAISTLSYVSEGDVGDFSPCLNFFYRYWPPIGFNGTEICQNYTNKYHFATLYSRERRSPWFSAYQYTTPAGKRPRGVWKYEPQVSLFGCEHFAKSLHRCSSAADLLMYTAFDVNMFQMCSRPE